MANPRPKTNPDAATVLTLPRIVHEVRDDRRTRLRVRLSWLAVSWVDPMAVEAHLVGIAHVESARVNRRAKSLIVTLAHDPGRATEARGSVLRAIAELRARDFRGRKSGDDEQDEDAVSALSMAAVVAALVPFLPFPLRRVLVFASVGSTVVKGLGALVTKGMSVEVLDAAAVGVPAVRGKLGTAATTSLILSLAGYIEQRASQRSDALVRSLLKTAPPAVWIARDGSEVEVPYADLEVGDHVIVRVGELIPVDGVVVSGGGTIDAAAVTGESIPVPVEAGAAIISGSMLLDGSLVVAAERVGDATTTVRISRFIERALAERSGLQRVADRMADRRAWITFGTAAGIYALTHSLGRIETISLVDFSCTTKLGTAVGIKGAIYEAGQQGLLLKGGDALDVLSRVDTVVFDKTGTLTTGRLTVTDVVSFDEGEWPRDRLLALAASLSEHTTHPVAASVVALAREQGLGHIGHEEVAFMVGHGLTSRVGGMDVALGSRHFLVDHQHVDFAAHEDRLDALSDAGNTLLYLSRDGRPLGAIALRDQPRAEAPAVLRRLRRLGVRQLVMITGDRSAQAVRVGRDLALDAVYAEAAPEEKAGILQAIRQDGRTVAYVGDGVNDGPALMASHIGIAMPYAADIARATADVVLVNDRLEGVADAIELSQAALGRLRRTLNWAALANTGVLVGAATGRLSPIMAALMHNGTTLVVLGACWATRSSLLKRRPTALGVIGRVAHG